MITVWKYEFRPARESIAMPRNAGILSVQVQDGKPCMWAIVDTEAPIEQRRLEIYGTGHEIPNVAGLRWVGTFQIPSDALVFHVFERFAKT